MSMNNDDICQGICCGCSACANICPTNSITMQEDEKGFLYPKINQNMCTNCQLCFKVCNSTVELKENIATFVAKHKDEKMLLSSQSGGAFTAISDCILKRSGVVYGVALDDNFEAVYIRAQDVKKRNLMRGSKYIPSRLEDTFTQINRDLKEQRYVLFAGLPCQTGGLLKYLKMRKQDTSRLYTIDIICHGTPSILLWRDLLKYYENRHHAKIESAVFRDKNWKNQSRKKEHKFYGGGWGDHVTTFYIKKNWFRTSCIENYFIPIWHLEIPVINVNIQRQYAQVTLQ